MALASGLGAQLGIALETAPGTYQAPSSCLTLLNETLKEKKDKVKLKGLRPDVLVQQDGLHLDTTRHVEGDIVPIPLSKGLGKIFTLLNGLTPTPTGAGTAKTWTFPIGTSAPDGKSATLQVGVPGTDGVTQAKSVIGCVISSLTLSMERGGALQMTANVWGADMLTEEPLVTAVYPAGAEAFGFRGSVLQFDDAAIGSCVRSISITFTFPKATDRFCLNGSGTALTPITNDQITVTGNFEFEFSNGWTQVDAFRDSTRRKLTLTNTALTEIETGIKPQINVEIPKFVVIDDATPVVAGPDLVTMTGQFEAVAGTAPAATITYVTTDTAL
ncbi:phage tail tube protein [Patulibacter defluvii]|uniref:phage tail tube protein n=1 Tax=Patulibacter defluvii TaxID=3095358 RepID=UPI002A754F71|nr:phage tail tube protein [Patulibacter sp. DM4]